jgi:hypothetical protein
MKIGTKSLLFGVHQFIWHPITVYIAWVELFGLPNFKETICIIIHDWGYWGSPNMDGYEGKQHPELGANIANALFGAEYRHLCLYHSRHYARKCKVNPSKLCWADKLSIKYDPGWFYLLRAKLSEELKEYRKIAHNSGQCSIEHSNKMWFKWIRSYLCRSAVDRRKDTINNVAS